jgi:hypothetical protein
LRYEIRDGRYGLEQGSDNEPYQIGTVSLEP